MPARCDRTTSHSRRLHGGDVATDKNLWGDPPPLHGVRSYRICCNADWAQFCISACGSILMHVSWHYDRWIVYRAVQLADIIHEVCEWNKRRFSFKMQQKSLAVGLRRDPLKNLQRCPRSLRRFRQRKRWESRREEEKGGEWVGWEGSDFRKSTPVPPRTPITAAPGPYVRTCSAGGY